MLSAASRYQVTLIFSGVIVIAVMSIVMFLICVAVERRLRRLGVPRPGGLNHGRARQTEDYASAAPGSRRSATAMRCWRACDLWIADGRIAAIDAGGCSRRPSRADYRDLRLRQRAGPARDSSILIRIRRRPCSAAPRRARRSISTSWRQCRAVRAAPCSRYASARWCTRSKCSSAASPAWSIIFAAAPVPSVEAVSTVLPGL